jgi:hypothetical protein
MNHRTKESLVECLERFMLLTSNPTRKGPANYKAANGPGLWDIDPQRIVLPILHCPMHMGLVDTSKIPYWSPLNTGLTLKLTSSVMMIQMPFESSTNSQSNNMKWPKLLTYELNSFSIQIHIYRKQKR